MTLPLRAAGAEGQGHCDRGRAGRVTRGDCCGEAGGPPGVVTRLNQQLAERVLEGARVACGSRLKGQWPPGGR
jgi:hypothetical protein